MILGQDKQHRQKEAVKSVNIRDAPVDWPSVRTRLFFCSKHTTDLCFISSNFCSGLANKLHCNYFPEFVIEILQHRMLTERRDTLKTDKKTRAQTASTENPVAGRTSSKEMCKN